MRDVPAAEFTGGGEASRVRRRFPLPSPLETLLRLGPRRAGRRLARVLRYRWLYPAVASLRFPTVAPENDGEAPGGFDPLCGSDPGELRRKAEELVRGRFTFLNLTVEEGGRVDWRQAPQDDPLWLYELHYGEWSLTLAGAFLVSGDARYRDTLIELLNSWIRENPTAGRPGWEPYPLSRRLVAWSRTALALRSDLAWRSFWRERLAPSLHRQARVLEANLETDLMNNHLLANHRALAWMGLLFPGWPGAERWRRRELPRFWSEMRRQVLPDGVHDERSISYHAIVLRDIVETARLCRAVGEPVPGDVWPIIGRMAAFLRAIRFPDGGFPMLNDSVPGYPPDVDGLLREAEEDAPATTDLVEAGARVFPDAGLALLDDGAGGRLVFDAGPMGSEHLPGHGHADTLGIMLWGGGRLLLADPGVYTYHDRAWRDRFRGTAAHNTVLVDGSDQCVFWGPFRVAYPPRARLISWSGSHAEGEHDGYRRLRHPVIHRRRVTRRGRGAWEVFDRLEGRGEHDFAVVLQFTTGARVIDQGPASVVVRWPGGTVLNVRCPTAPPGAVARVESGWISLGWNRKEEAPRLVLAWRSGVPVENRLLLTVEA